MEGLEIILLITGIVSVVFSFFLEKDKTEVQENVDLDMSHSILKIKEAAVIQEEELKQRVQKILEEQSLKVLSETEEKLSRISNDKIIAVDEFSNQILEKIENNHQEVIFLYDMFQKKEEEMKSVMNKLEQVRRENKTSLEHFSEEQKTKNPSEAAEKADTQAEAVFTTQADLLQKMADLKKKEEVPAQDTMTPEEKKRQEQVLTLYNQKKNVKEISKQLSMGQGEVQLIIDLYGK